MLKLISGIVIAVALMFAPGFARANEISCMPKAEFLEAVKVAEPRIIELLPEHAEKLVRQAAAEAQLELPTRFKWTIAAAELRSGKIGIVFLRNGCYSLNLSYQVSPGMFDKWLEQAGITDLDWKKA